LKKPLSIPSDYNYDFAILKRTTPAPINLSKMIGRETENNRKNLIYSYTHYNYDDYVWRGKSKVFSNTKTHLIDFKNQTNRYTRKTSFKNRTFT
jgi:hypothetical protein